jgi:hypothetical protein
MHDRSSGYGVYEEPGCELKNSSEEWLAFYSDATHVQFANIATGLDLGVTCPATNGENIVGLNPNGNCTTWIQETP